MIKHDDPSSFDRHLLGELDKVLHPEAAIIGAQRERTDVGTGLFGAHR
jgi:hypothetical protein